APGLRAYLDSHEFTPDHRQRVIVSVGHAFFQRDDAVVRDSDVFGAHLGAATSDVAHAGAVLVFQLGHPIVVVEGIHFETGDADHEARTDEPVLGVSVA